jgi:hypothetical protein
MQSPGDCPGIPSLGDMPQYGDLSSGEIGDNGSHEIIIEYMFYINKTRKSKSPDRGI